MKRIAAYLGLVLLVLSLAACLAAPQSPVEGASISGPLDESSAGERSWFTIEARAANEPVGLDFRGAVAQGRLRAWLRGPAGQTVWEHEATLGAFAVNTVVHLPQPGQYSLGINWDGPMVAQYSLKWQPGEVKNPQLTPLALLGGVGMILVALLAVGWVIWKKESWSYLGWGALAWAITVALKFAWAIPFNSPIYRTLYGVLPQWAAAPIFYLYVGALTGAFEVALTWLALRYTRLGQARWGQAVAFGLGFGAVEALLLGVSSLGGALAGLLAPSALPYETLASLSQLNNPLFGLAPIVERAATILVHLVCNVLLFYAVQKNQVRWMWLSFAYKTALDTVAAWAQFWGVSTLPRIWLVEGMIVVLSAVGVWGISWLKQRYAAPRAEPAILEQEPQ